LDSSTDNPPLEDAAFVFAFVPFDGRPMPALPGDANYDGVVNWLDAAVLAAHWGDTGATWATGDLNLDDVVNAGDASLLAANWSANSEGASAPEPCVWTSLLGGLLCPLLLREFSPTGPRWSNGPTAPATTGDVPVAK
jgi:hypothetical protein